MMKLTTTALGLVLALAAAPAAAQMGYSPAPMPPQQTAVQPAQPAQSQAPGSVQIKLSNKAQKAIIDLQTAVKANDRASIPAKLAAAQAVAQTKDDRYAIGKLQLDAAVAANDNAAAAAAAETIAASGFLDNAKVAGLYRQIGVLAFNGKQYDHAAGLFQKAAALTPNDLETLKDLGLAQNLGGHKAEASATFARALQLTSVGGKKPEEDLYKQAIGIAYGAKTPAAIDLGRQWVAAYPSPSSWHDALVIYRNLGNVDTSQVLDIMRLARATGSMQGTGDYNLYTAETINSQNYGEAKAVLDEGLASGKIKAADPVVQDIQNALKGKAAPTAAELSAREAAAKVPNAYLRVGDAYFGAGNYQKAAEMYRAALDKGADANLANLRLGEALARAGDKAGAAAALGKVGGSLAEIAKFWLIYAQRQG
jgi:tetratricopeptide (TPR) repeat protein